MIFDIEHFNMHAIYDFAHRLQAELHLQRPLAMKNAWLRYKLEKGVAVFKFRKVDGTIREAVGTLNPNFLGGVQPENNANAANPALQKYYDLDKGGWRCFYKENVI